MTQQRKVAGLWCGEVLEKLDAYTDNELDPQARHQVEAHLAGCDWCETFGGRYIQTVRLLRKEFAGEVDAVDDAVSRALEQVDRTD